MNAVTNPDDSIAVTWIDIDAVTGTGTVTASPSSNRVTVYVSRTKTTNTLLISSSTIFQNGGVQSTGSSNMLQIGESVSFTGSAVGPGPTSSNVYTLRIFSNG
jgi:hypothetical protein